MVEVVVVIVIELIVPQETPGGALLAVRANTICSCHNMQLSSLLLAAHEHEECWTRHLNAILFYFSGILSNKQCRGVLVAVNNDRRCVLVPADDVHRNLELPRRLFTKSPY